MKLSTLFTIVILLPWNAGAGNPPPGYYFCCSGCKCEHCSDTPTSNPYECNYALDDKGECGVAVRRLTASACGDPHFKMWDGRRYSYHGEGDHVLVRNPGAYGGNGVEIQIRTTLSDFFSFIESVAIRVGDDVFEVTMDRFWINGAFFGSSTHFLPMRLANFVIERPFPLNKATVYRVTMNDGDFIDVLVYKKFISVNIHGSGDNFDNAVGLLGEYGTSAMLARDGKTVLDDYDEFGAEWQVLSDETNLFQTSRDPQHPARPNMPSEEAATRRRLVAKDDKFKTAAERACADKDPEDFDFCVFDVLATGDVDMAGAW